MPKGPKGEKRPADVIGNAVHVMRIAIGEIEEDAGPDDGKDKAAQAMGRKGGAARASKLTPEQRQDIARKAAAKRWGKAEHSRALQFCAVSQAVFVTALDVRPQTSHTAATRCRSLPCAQLTKLLKRPAPISPRLSIARPVLAMR